MPHGVTRGGDAGDGRPDQGAPAADRPVPKHPAPSVVYRTPAARKIRCSVPVKDTHPRTAPWAPTSTQMTSWTVGVAVAAVYIGGLPYSVDGYEYGCGGRSFMPAPFSNTGPALSRWALGTSWTQARRERLVDIGISVQPSGHPWFPGSQDGNKKLYRAGHSRT